MKLFKIIRTVAATLTLIAGVSSCAISAEDRVDKPNYFTPKSQFIYYTDNSSGKAEQQVKPGKSDSVIVQKSEMGFGKLNIKLGYQSVGQHFSGFNALKDSKMVPDDVINQLQSQKGLNRTSVSLNYGSENNKAGFDIIKDASGQVSTRELGLAGRNVGLSFYSRSVDKGFSRLGDLSRDDKTQMALEVRRQFNSGATAEQVTDADRAAVVNEAGLSRNNIRANFKSGGVAAGYQSLNITDGSDDITRNSINLSGRNFGLTWMHQEIGRSFGRLSGLAPVEQGEFGNEYGMERTNITGTAKLGSVDTALSIAKVTDGVGSVSKQSLSVKGKKFDVSANVQDISPNFSRSLDLADSDRKQMAQDQGYRKSDITARITISPKLGIESYYMNSSNESEKKDKSQVRNKISFAPDQNTRISFFHDQYSFSSSNGNISSYLHEIFSIDRKIGMFQFSGSRDTNTVQEGDQTGSTTTITTMHLESSTSKRDWFGVDRKTVDYGNGRSESTNSLSFKSRPVSNLQIRANLSSTDRNAGQDEASTDVIGEWGIGKNIKASISSSKQTMGGATSRENSRVVVDTQVLDGAFSWEMAEGKTADGSRSGRRGFRFVSNRDPGKRLHFDLGYASRDLGAGDPFMIKLLNLDMQINASTSLAYNYFSYIEKPDGNVENKGGSTIKLSSALNKRMNLVAIYGVSDDYDNSTAGTKINLGIAGTLSNGASVELFISQEEWGGLWGSSTDRIYKIKYDHRVSADNYLSFSGTLKTRDDNNPQTPKNDFEGRLDFRKSFN